MNMEQMQQFKKMKQDIELLKAKIKEIESKPKPKRKANVNRQSDS